MENSCKKKNGFTLIELLVVVIIIGVLASIAVPGYFRSREKSQAAEALSVLGTLVNAEQSYALLHNGNFTSDFSDLDIDLTQGNTLPNNEVLRLKNFDITLSEEIANLVNTAYVRADRVKNNNSIYSLYKCMDSSTVLCIDRDNTDNVTCEMLGLDTAQKSADPCGGVPNDASGCGLLSGFWATATGTCYESAEERCSAVSGSLQGGICKFVDNDFSKPNQILDAGMACYGNKAGSHTRDSNGSITSASGITFTIQNASCYKPIINNGGVCYGNTKDGCSESIINGGLCQAAITEGCFGVTINNGGVCNSGTGSVKACYFATVNAGGTCEGTADQGCYGSTINEGGICRGGDVGHDACKNSVINSGGICIGKGLRSCREVVLNEGAIFVAHDSTSGLNAIYNGGCCISCNPDTSYCPSDRQCSVSSAEKERYCAM